MDIANADDVSYGRVDESRPRLRILAPSMALDPLGGVEICTLQDTVALAARGHHLDMHYGSDGSLRPIYEAAGVGLYGPYSFALNKRRPIRTLRDFAPAAKVARRRKPDVLWLNRFEHIVWGQIVARWAGCPIVCHLHGPPMYRRLRDVSRGVAHFIAVSEFIRDAYIAGGLQPERISLVYNAIPQQQYPFGTVEDQRSARRTLGLPQDARLVLCYGQLTPEKGIPSLLKAWRMISSANPRAILILVDSMASDESSALEEPVAQELRQLDPKSYRRFPMTSNVVPYLHASDVVVFPTLLKEAFGRVVIEGMATGRPVVASRTGAVPEILSGPMARFLVEPNSPAELAEKLRSVLDWRESEPGLGEDCARWVHEQFPFRAHVDNVEGILQDHRRRQPAH
jgi:glycosyltransferase involved in cell wall biosynthesis